MIYQSSKTINMLAFAFNNTTVNINPLLAIKIHFYRYDSRRTKERNGKVSPTTYILPSKNLLKPQTSKRERMKETPTTQQ